MDSRITYTLHVMYPDQLLKGAFKGTAQDWRYGSGGRVFA
jgi:hypothetical protein